MFYIKGICLQLKKFKLKNTKNLRLILRNKSLFAHNMFVSVYEIIFFKTKDIKLYEISAFIGVLKNESMKKE
jgi:hypothetical protein